MFILHYTYAKKLNIHEITHDGDSLDKLMRPSTNCIAIIAAGRKFSVLARDTREAAAWTDLTSWPAGLYIYIYNILPVSAHRQPPIAAQKGVTICGSRILQEYCPKALLEKLKHKAPCVMQEICEGCCAPDSPIKN